MPVEQMNISLPPKMARFIRSKVKAGQYTNASEVVRDAVRHMQEMEISLDSSERARVRASVAQGLRDIETGQYEEFDEKGLREFFAGVIRRGKSRLAGNRKQSVLNGMR